MLSLTKSVTTVGKEEELEELTPDPLLFLDRFKDHAAQHIHNAYEYVLYLVVLSLASNLC